MTWISQMNSMYNTAAAFCFPFWSSEMWDGSMFWKVHAVKYNPDFKGRERHKMLSLNKSFVLAPAVKPIQQPPPLGRPAPARWVCRGGLRIVGLITRGQVLDWCPPAVLFYPIRTSICCPTQLLSGHTSHPHRWERSFYVCVHLYYCCLYKDRISQVRSRKPKFLLFLFVLDGGRYGAQKYEQLTNQMSFHVTVHRCSAFLIPAHLFTPHQSNFDCHCCFD